MTTQKVIIGILAMLLIIPVFNIYSGLYGNYTGLAQGGLQILHDLSLQVGSSARGAGRTRGKRRLCSCGKSRPLASEAVSGRHLGCPLGPSERALLSYRGSLSRAKRASATRLGVVILFPKATR